MRKVSKKIKSIFKEGSVYSGKEMERYLGALNEMHSENLKGIREGSVPINKKLDEIKETLSEHTKKLDSHTEMVGILMEDTSIIKADLKRKVDYDEFLSLVKRVQAIEVKI